MSVSQSPALRSLYRRLLRELPSRSSQSASNTILSHPSPLQQQIRSSFATSVPSASESSISSQIKEAEQLVQYVKAQRSYITLVERYNPGMTMDEEERVRLSARRVGMNMPVDYVEEKQ